MPLYLTESDVAELLSMKEAIAQVRTGFELQAEGNVTNLPRTRIQTKNGKLNIMPAAVDGIGVAGLKVYFGGPAGASFVVILFSTEESRPLCFIEAKMLGQLRTGAASGVMTDVMARKDSTVLGCIGTGYQAESQIEAVSCVRDLDRVVVCSRSSEKAAAFAKKMSGRLGLSVEAVESTEQLGQIDILVTATKSKSPVVRDEHIPSDCHINAMGANDIQSAELQVETVTSAKTLVVDSKEQAMMESGDLVRAFETGKLRQEFVNEGWQALAGTLRHNPDASTDRTIFKSLGIGLEDVITARYIYEKAVENKVGREL